MPAELEIRLRHWLAAVAAAALVHALAIAGFEAGTTTGWLGADGTARRPEALRGSLRVSLGIPAGDRVEPAESPAAAERSSETLQRPKPPVHRAADTPESPVTAATEAIPRATGRTPTANPSRSAAAREEQTRIADRSPGSPLPEASSDRAESHRAALASELDGGSGRLDAGIGLRAGSSGGNRTGPATGVGSSKAVDYFTTLYERVSRAHDYPRRARREEIEGRVLLSIRIDRQGRVSSCQVRESSGSSILDRHAVRTIERAAPFGAVPEGLADSDLDFDLPLEYQLR